MLDDLVERLAEVRADATLRVVVLCGAAEKAFAAGANIREMAPMGPDQAHGHGGQGQAATVAIEHLPLPVIAAVHGSCLGGGCEIALACDFVVASDDAKFGQPEVNLGVMPGWGGTQRLPRRVGATQARVWVFTGRPFSAEEAPGPGLGAPRRPEGPSPPRGARPRRGTCGEVRRRARRREVRRPARGRPGAFPGPRLRAPPLGGAVCHRRPEGGDAGVPREAPLDARTSRPVVPNPFNRGGSAGPPRRLRGAESGRTEPSPPTTVPRWLSWQSGSLVRSRSRVRTPPAAVGRTPAQTPARTARPVGRRVPNRR